MDKQDIIRMAREAGIRNDCDGIWCDADQLKRFAALVIKPWADQLEVERKRFQELNDIVAVGMQHARADEREACAELCERMARRTDDIRSAALEMAAENILARGNT